jgi:hypothetical protein
MMKENLDEVLNQVKLNMTPERRKRMMAAARELVPMVRKLTSGPAEAMALLGLMLDSLAEDCGATYRGTVLVQDKEIPQSACHGCGANLNRAGEVGGANPEPGYATICSYCGALHVFDDDLKAVKPSKEREAELMAEPQVAVMVKTAKALRGAR